MSQEEGQCNQWKGRKGQEGVLVKGGRVRARIRKAGTGTSQAGGAGTGIHPWQVELGQVQYIPGRWSCDRQVKPGHDSLRQGQ